MAAAPWGMKCKKKKKERERRRKKEKQNINKERNKQNMKEKEWFNLSAMSRPSKMPLIGDEKRTAQMF